MNSTNVKGYFILAIAGAIVATLCDANHVYTHTLSYPDPVMGSQAWWVPLGFFCAFLMMSTSYALITRSLASVVSVAESTSDGDMAPFVEALMAFVMVYLLSGFGNESPDLLSAIFYGTFAIRWLFTYDKMWMLLLAIIMAVGGMFAEGLLAHFDLVAYRQEDVFNVPYWLGGLYMHGAFALREGMRFLVYR